MQIRKNTKAFKTIQAILSECQGRGDREKLVRLYITKAGHSIGDRINIEGIEGDSGFFYDMNYQSIISNLSSPNHQLHQSDEVPGIYFFHSTSNKTWDETPFEFDKAITEQFKSLSDLPLTRAKEKAKKFVLPVSKEPPAKRGTKEKIKIIKPTQVLPAKPTQPNYKLKQKIEFTNLDKVISRTPLITKKDILDYYNRIAPYILPHLSNRPVSISLQADSTKAIATLEQLASDGNENIPEWIQTFPPTKTKSKDHLLLCNDKEHLLYYAEMGMIAINTFAAHAKTLTSPDYCLIRIQSDSEFSKVLQVALATKDIITGLQLPSFVKIADNISLDVYILLDGKSEYQEAAWAAEYLCKLIHLKVPDLVRIISSKDREVEKASLDYTLNQQMTSVIAPYSLVSADLANVAAPLPWEDITKDFTPAIFNAETIFHNLKQAGDPLQKHVGKKVNAQALLERLESNYSFLF